MTRRRKEDIGAILLFALLATLLLNKALLPGYTLLPLDLIQTIAPWNDLDLGPLANRLISDPFYSFYPRRVILNEAIQSGQLPMWNPGIMIGTPSIANPNFQPIYPPNLLAALVLPAQHALPWLAWFHLTLTGTLMYLLLRRHRLHWLACILGGGVWLLNGYTLVWLENPHRLSSIAWLPGIFWAYEAASQDKKAGWAALAGLFLGLTILGGQMQFVFGVGILLGLYGLLKAALSVHDKQRLPYRPLVYLALVGLIGLGIGSLIILPAAEFASLSQRSQFTAEGIQNSRWPLAQLVTLLAPDYYGNPSTPVAYWGTGNFAETAAYFSVVALLLALTAPFVAPRKPSIYYAVTLALGTLLLVLGSPLARLLIFLPGGGFVPLGRLLFMIPLAGSWLAAAGLDGWMTAATDRQVRSRWLVLGLALLLLVVIALWTSIHLGERLDGHWPSARLVLIRGGALLAVSSMLLLTMNRRPELVAALLLALALVDLLSWGWRFNPTISTEHLYPDNEVVQWLKQDESLYRVLPLQSGSVVFGPNVLTVYGFQEIGGYTPLIQDRYRQLYKSIDDTVDISWMAPNNNMLVMSRFDPMVSLLNTKYVLSARELPFGTVLLGSNEGCESPLPLGDKVLTGSLVATGPGLNRVDLALDETGEPLDGPLEFWLWRDVEDGELIAHITQAFSRDSEGGLQTFFFAPIPDSPGQTFVWGIEGPDGLAICHDVEERPHYAAYGTWLLDRGSKQGVRIYENPNVLPRAFLVHDLVRRPADRVLETLHDPAFNYYRSAIVEDEIPDHQLAQLPGTASPGQSQVEITGYDLHQVNISVDSPAAGLLVLSDAFYPGWSATVDGQPAPIHRVDGALRGVFVPTGVHDVRFSFQPTTLGPSLVLLSISLLLALSLIVFSLWKKEK
jgi:hypothetical protein